MRPGHPRARMSLCQGGPGPLGGRRRRPRLLPRVALAAVAGLLGAAAHAAFVAPTAEPQGRLLGRGGRRGAAGLRRAAGAGAEAGRETKAGGAELTVAKEGGKDDAALGETLQTPEMTRMEREAAARPPTLRRLSPEEVEQALGMAREVKPIGEREEYDGKTATMDLFSENQAETKIIEDATTLLGGVFVLFAVLAVVSFQVFMTDNAERFSKGGSQEGVTSYVDQCGTDAQLWKEIFFGDKSCNKVADATPPPDAPLT